MPFCGATVQEVFLVFVLVCVCVCVCVCVNDKDTLCQHERLAVAVTRWSRE